MHDRRIDGVTHTFGNAGTLFMNAMTWWDHETLSKWSQPWGRAIEGPLKGVVLNLLPSQLTTWENWVREHPKTTVMVNDVNRLGSRRQEFSENFVIGLVIAENAKAYYFTDAQEAGVINDTLGDVPVVVWAGHLDYYSYIRDANGQVLTFRREGDSLVDEETGSTWDVVRGLAVAGPLEGNSLQPVPSLSSFDWAWEDFYPNSGFYTP